MLIIFLQFNFFLLVIDLLLIVQDASSVTLALSLDNQRVNGRPLRVQRSTEKGQSTQQKHGSEKLKRGGMPKVSFEMRSCV